MILTPSDFQPLLAPIEHPRTRTFVFRRHDVLLREEGLALPDEGTVATLPIEPRDVHPVGLWDDAYYRTTWVPPAFEPPPGHVFKGMRALFGAHGDHELALAGFLEAGESVEEAIHREVLEEVGLRVRDLRYFASQPWAFPHSLMLAFTAEYAGGELRPDPAEIAEARWFGPGDPLPQFATGISISGELIRANLPRAAA